MRHSVQEVQISYNIFSYQTNIAIVDMTLLGFVSFPKESNLGY